MDDPPDGPAPGAKPESGSPDHASRLDLVSRWADDLAHEIKNPLHAMVINLELVKRWASTGEPQAIVDRAEVVEAELHRVHDLIDSLLRLIRPWPETESVSMDQVFDVLLPVFTARARIRKITYAHEPGDARAAVSPGDLAQLLVGLVDHAIESTPDGGRIESRSASSSDGARLTFLTGAQGGATRSGSEGVARIGLGLEIARQIADRAGGSLAIEPTPSGERVTLVLPVDDSA